MNLRENGLAAGADKLAFYSTHLLQVGPAGKALITVYDNGRFFAQIAGFLAQSTGRCLTLSDFPTLTVTPSE